MCATANDSNDSATTSRGSEVRNMVGCERCHDRFGHGQSTVIRKVRTREFSGGGEPLATKKHECV